MQKDFHQTEIEYLLVLDFEATCIQNKKIEPCAQIIEWPVIVVNTRTGQKLDRFHYYLKPRFNPQLTKFCTQLTGIKQETVDAGISIEDLLEKFDEWIRGLPYLKQDNFTFVTCGDWDLNTCLKGESRVKKLAIKPYLTRYINIKKYFDIFTQAKDRNRGMMEMIQKLGLKHEGKHHSGIDDVENICNICIALVLRGATFPKKQINSIKI